MTNRAIFRVRDVKQSILEIRDLLAGKTLRLSAGSGVVVCVVAFSP
jgi:hypothetical protein